MTKSLLQLPKEHLLALSDVKAYIEQHHNIEMNEDTLAEIIQLRTDVREAIETYDVEISICGSNKEIFHIKLLPKSLDHSLQG
ncbi:hypothetical protein BVG16_08580 [Paenibacillus selenitireducens]|uniref:Uncharacterized protein n=1 Tax=Paenibacillus selenitireducens TaxID=1324314 RepID=A0A1T2XH79_9BACL|nr:hypothetical protein [Paenibacillus selenitireducens]OPA79142.1 hypothetical protein BVG16_08580 [Paenibacillus selenitireducens]